MQNHKCFCIWKMYIPTKARLKKKTLKIGVEKEKNVSTKILNTKRLFRVWEEKNVMKILGFEKGDKVQFKRDTGSSSG